MHFKVESSHQDGVLMIIYLYMVMMNEKLIFHVFEKNNTIICIAKILKSPSLSLVGGSVKKGNREREYKWQFTHLV